MGLPIMGSKVHGPQDTQGVPSAPPCRLRAPETVLDCPAPILHGWPPGDTQQFFRLWGKARASVSSHSPVCCL